MFFNGKITPKPISQYIYDMKKLKEWYWENKENYELKSIHNISITKGRAVPRSHIKQFLLDKWEVKN